MVAREKCQITEKSQVLRRTIGSATRSERDKLDLRAGSDFDACVIAREDRLLVELDDDWYALQAKAGKQRAHAERALHGVSLTIE